MTVSNKELLKKFLKHLDKEDCKETEQELCYHFSFYREDPQDQLVQQIGKAYISGDISSEDMSVKLTELYKNAHNTDDEYVSYISLLAHKAMHDLYWTAKTRQADTPHEFLKNKDNIKTVQTFKNKLTKVLQEFENEKVLTYLAISAEEDYIEPNPLTLQDFLKPLTDSSQQHELGEIDYHGRMREYKRLVDRLFIFTSQIQTDIELAKRPRGKPSLNNFYKFVYHIAKIYEELSSEHFTVQNHKDSKKGYLPMTSGMDFVWTSIEWLHREAKAVLDIEAQFSDQNIANACDKARTKIRKGRQ